MQTEWNVLLAFTLFHVSPLEDAVVLVRLLLSNQQETDPFLDVVRF